MKDFVSFFLLLIVITIFYVYLETKSLDVVYTMAIVDNKEYLVRNLPDKQEAADLMAYINNNLKKLIASLNNIEKQTNYSEANIDDIKRLTINYREGNISESNPGNKYTSYSINKGEKIVFCIRSKDGLDTLVPLNTMLFVAIHELGHLMTKSVGHNQEFWDNMSFLLKEAIDMGIYEKQDYFKYPVEYCGTTINDSPLK
jgi:predicted metal-dependent hydrolase